MFYSGNTSKAIVISETFLSEMHLLDLGYTQNVFVLVGRRGIGKTTAVVPFSPESTGDILCDLQCWSNWE